MSIGWTEKGPPSPLCLTVRMRLSVRSASGDTANYYAPTCPLSLPFEGEEKKEESSLSIDPLLDYSTDLTLVCFNKQNIKKDEEQKKKKALHQSFLNAGKALHMKAVTSTIRKIATMKPTSLYLEINFKEQNESRATIFYFAHQLELQSGNANEIAFFLAKCRLMSVVCGGGQVVSLG